MLAFSDGVHTTITPKGTGWANQANGAVLSTHRTTATAIVTGRLMAKRHGTDYTIHRKDGTVIQTRSYAISPIE